MIANVFGRTARRRFARHSGAKMLPLLVIAAALGACKSSGPTLTDARYDGPPIQINRDGKMYVLKLEAPTPGWTFTLDQVKPSLDHATMTVTARRPDPSYMYSQVIVNQELMTTVETTTPVDVYARVAEFVSTSKTKTYQFLASSAPTRNAE